MASVLFVLNDAPYGNERTFNAFRHAMAIAKVRGTEVRLFLMADAAACAVAGQVTPEGYYSIESLLKGLIAKKSLVGL